MMDEKLDRAVSTHPLVGCCRSECCVHCQTLDPVSLGEHGLDVATTVVTEDRRLGLTTATLRFATRKAVVSQ